jgi:hypothetical protein
MLEDPQAAHHQSGKLRDEGYYTVGYVKAPKQYDLGEDTRRMKSFPRRVQSRLETQHFMQDPRSNRVVATTTSLRPTLGMEMTLVEESRTSQHGLNLTLHALVSAVEARAGVTFPRRPLTSVVSGLRAHLNLGLKMERVRAYFDRYARLGQTRSAQQLADFCRRNKIPFDLQRLRRIRHEFKYSAFAQGYRRPLKYMASSVSKYGVVHLDMANFMPQHRSLNGGHAAFLCAVECLSGQLVAIPCRDLTTASWRSAVQKLAETTVIHAIRVVCSDRDAAVKSEADGGLRALVKQRYGISWLFLKNRSKVGSSRCSSGSSSRRPCYTPHTPAGFQERAYDTLPQRATLPGPEG